MISVVDHGEVQHFAIKARGTNNELYVRDEPTGQFAVQDLVNACGHKNDFWQLLILSMTHPRWPSKHNRNHPGRAPMPATSHTSNYRRGGVGVYWVPAR